MSAAQKASLQALADTSPFQETIGWQLVRWDDGEAELAYRILPQHLNRGGILHGGIYATLLDSVMGYAAIGRPAQLDKGTSKPRGVTLSFTVNYLDMVHEGDLRVIGWRTGGGKSVAFARAEITDQAGRKLAEATGTFRRFAN